MKTTLVIFVLLIPVVMTLSCGPVDYLNSDVADSKNHPIRTTEKLQDIVLNSGSCAGCSANYCGKKSPDGCWCDDLCEKYDDCCRDKKKICDDPEPTPEPNEVLELEPFQEVIISSGQGEWKYFKMKSCNGPHIQGSLNHGNGNPDFYLQSESLPTKNSYCYKSTNPGTSENFLVVHSTLYIGVYATGAYENVKIRAGCFHASNPPGPVCAY